MTSSSTLQINNLSAGYKQELIVQNITLAPINPGQLVALVGSNGAGKSTFLRAISGLIPATGQVIFQQQDLLSLSNLERAQHFGLMPQNIPIGNSLNVFETVMSALMATKQDLPTQQAYLKAAQILEQLKLDHLANSSLNQLSGGQRQMVSLAQALVRDPEILLLDEPTSALDMRHQFFVMQTVRQLANNGKLIFIVLHDLSLAARWADRVVVLNNRRLYCDGPPEQSITPQILAEVYGVQARVEQCSQGQLQIMVDDLI